MTIDDAMLPTHTETLPIESVGVRFLKARVNDGIAMSFAPLRHRSMALVEVVTENGLTGYGESWINYPAWAAHERRATFKYGVVPLLIGEDGANPQAIRAKLLRSLLPVGRQWGAPGPIAQAISAVDMALWDLVGKAQQLSAAALASGRQRSSVKAYASSLGPSEVARQAEQCLEIGLTAAKVKVGFDREIDEKNLRTAREVLGDEATLLADANQAWSLNDALEFAPVLRDVGVACVEEPIRGDGVAELSKFHRQTGLAVATGENLYQLAGFRPYIESPDVAFLQPDVSKTGGFTDALAITRSAGQHGKKVLPHLYGGALAYAATLQLAACSPEVSMLEYDIRHNPLRDPLLSTAPRLENGFVSIPDGPGLGVDLELERVTEFADEI